MKYSRNFEAALVYATQLHDGHFRKATDVPYVIHLLAVAALVGEAGGSEDEVIAALLHDAVHILAEFERDQICERTKSAMNYKRSKGERVGSVPYGFDLAADGVNLLENPKEQAALKIIDELHADGMSLRKIASELNGRKIITKGWKKAWSHTTVQRIVKRLPAKPSWTGSLAC